MVTAPALADLRARGIRVESPSPGRLRLVVPAGALEPDELKALRARKAELLAALQAEQAGAGNLTEAPLLEARAQVGAVLVASPRYGEAWLVVDPCMRPELAAEEARRHDPRPVLLAQDVARLQGKPEKVIQAALEAARAFPGVRIQ